MVAVVVSQANGCLYCLVAHGQALREALGDPIQGDRITLDWRRAGLDDRRRAICAFAEKLTLRPREVEPEDVQSLRDAGLTEEEAWDVAEIASMYNLTNRMAMATGMLPNPEYHAMSRSALDRDRPALALVRVHPLVGELQRVARRRRPPPGAARRPGRRRSPCRPRRA